LQVNIKAVEVPPAEYLRKSLGMLATIRCAELAMVTRTRTRHLASAVQVARPGDLAAGGCRRGRLAVAVTRGLAFVTAVSLGSSATTAQQRATP
jgi:hypothetical protein